MARSSTPINDTSVSDYSVDFISPIKRISYSSSSNNNSVIPEKRHCKGIDLAVPDHINSPQSEHGSDSYITDDNSDGDDVIYPSLLENTTGDSFTDVIFLLMSLFQPLAVLQILNTHRRNFRFHLQVHPRAKPSPHHQKALEMWLACCYLTVVKSSVCRI